MEIESEVQPHRQSCVSAINKKNYMFSYFLPGPKRCWYVYASVIHGISSLGIMSPDHLDKDQHSMLETIPLLKQFVEA